MSTQEHGGFSLRSPTCGNADDQVVEIVGRRDELVVIQFEEGEGGGKGDSLVAVHERMGLTEMEEVRSRHLGESRMEKLACERRRRHCER